MKVNDIYEMVANTKVIVTDIRGNILYDEVENECARGYLKVQNKEVGRIMANQSAIIIEIAE